MDGLDDLGVVDALEVDRGDAEVMLPSWRWVTISGTPFARHFDGMRVSKLVRSETPPDARRDGGPAQVRARGGT